MVRVNCLMLNVDSYWQIKFGVFAQFSEELLRISHRVFNRLEPGEGVIIFQCGWV